MAERAFNANRFKYLVNFILITLTFSFDLVLLFLQLQLERLETFNRALQPLLELGQLDAQLSVVTRQLRMTTDRDYEHDSRNVSTHLLLFAGQLMQILQERDHALVFGRTEVGLLAVVVAVAERSHLDSRL